MTALPLDAIRRDGGTQPRDHVSIEVAREYAEAMADGATFPPVTVFYDGTEYWLADGFHRAEACGLLDVTEIDADVRQGTRRDAILFSVGANAAHGYRRSNMDKRRAVVTLLNDPEWAQWSDREIARRCYVGPSLVNTLRPKSSLPEKGSETVRTYLDRHGNPSHMNVSAIGKKPLPTVAGRTPDRRPDSSFGRGEVCGVAEAARMTGFEVRKLTEIARSGEIDGAEKSAGSWSFKTEPLRQWMKSAPEPEPEQPLVYDHAANAPMMAKIDTIEALVSGPSAGEMLAWWRTYLGAGFADGAIERAFEWMRAFHADFPAAERKRRAMLDALNERIDDVA